MKILSGHISPETAFVVDDYPYGFRLRCKIRYWLEFHKTRGFRFLSQTTNPKRPGEFWNKPKASTYCKFGAAMYLDENEHVTWTGLSEYSSGAEAQAFKDKYFEGVPEAGRSTLNQWVASKVAYDAARADAKADGKIPPLEVGIVEAHKTWLDEALKDYQPETRDQKLAVIWRSTHADFKGRIDGERHILVLREGGTHSVPLTDLTDEEIEYKLPKRA
jgi:hypothetical protein